MFTTEYGTIELADVSFSRSLEIDAAGLLLSDNKASGGELAAGVNTSREPEGGSGNQIQVSET